MAGSDVFVRFSPGDVAVLRRLLGDKTQAALPRLEMPPPFTRASGNTQQVGSGETLS